MTKSRSSLPATTLPAPSKESQENYIFNEGEGVLCLCHTDSLIYDAKVLAREFRKNKSDGQVGPHYFVHYRGWSSKFDEWAPESRVMKLTAENIAEMNNLKQNAALAKKAKGSADKKTATSSKGKKRHLDSFEDREEDYLRRPEIKLSIPEKLKTQLVDEWEWVTKNQKLVTLPKSLNVLTILDRYREEMSISQAGADSREAIPKGLEDYFNKALGTILLYKFERKQYADKKKQFPNMTPCQIYGAEHLLRLFVQLPALIAHTQIDDESVKVLKDHLTEFLLFLETHFDEYFTADNYEQATPAYITAMKS